MTFELLIAALTPPRVRVLYYLIERGATTMGNLAEAMDMSPAGLTAHVACLREAGLVETWPDGRLVWARARCRGVEVFVDWLPGDEPRIAPSDLG
jgi:DNA-binding transcriptional ArsR family regulator